MDNTIKVAKKLLDENNIEYTIINDNQINCRHPETYELYIIYSTGTITTPDKTSLKGVNNFINMLVDRYNHNPRFLSIDNF